MDEKQLLDAIRAVVREETAGLATREEISVLATREEISGLETRIDDKISNLEVRMDGLATREEMIKQNNETRVLIESGYQRIENLLKEDYGRVVGAVAKTADYDEVKSTVAEHRSALENHNQRLTVLEKKAI